MTDTQIVKELVGLEPELNILKSEEVKKNGVMVKLIYVSNGVKRVRCTKCNKCTRNIHSKLNITTNTLLTNVDMSKQGVGSGAGYVEVLNGTNYKIIKNYLKT